MITNRNPCAVMDEEFSLVESADESAKDLSVRHIVLTS